MYFENLEVVLDVCCAEFAELDYFLVSESTLFLNLILTDHLTIIFTDSTHLNSTSFWGFGVLGLDLYVYLVSSGFRP